MPCIHNDIAANKPPLWGESTSHSGLALTQTKTRSMVAAGSGDYSGHTVGIKADDMFWAGVGELRPTAVVEAPT